MLGLMQDWSLTIEKIIDHAARWHGPKEIVTRASDGAILRSNYAALREAALAVAAALRRAGLQPGDRIATLAWNSAAHLELWYGIMGMGGVCHTLNPRFSPAQIAWIVNHAQDRVIFADVGFLEILRQILPQLPSIEFVVILSDREPAIGFGDKLVGPSLRTVLYYGDFASADHEPVAWGGFDESSACGLCYTSGTVGDPKGVLYSHRSNFLHTMISLQSDVFGLSERDVVLPIVPMYHANAWGLAFSAPAVGAKMVMPGQQLDGASLHELIESEGVTFAAGVPTVWLNLLDYLSQTGSNLSSLERIIVGGAACPEVLLRSFHERYGIEVIQAWGMTEMSPVGTAATLTGALRKQPFDVQLPILLKQGRVPLGIDLEIVGDDGEPLPRNGLTPGYLKAAGPHVAKAYYGEAESALDERGYMPTGDIATIDSAGFMEITDRTKDVIKSGGEWISSIQLENIALGHPDVDMAAVISIPSKKWGERPLLIVKLRKGARTSEHHIAAYLAERVAKYWVPERILFKKDIPLGSTGKIDKKRLRTLHARETVA